MSIWYSKVKHEHIVKRRTNMIKRLLTEPITCERSDKSINSRCLLADNKWDILKHI